MSRRLSDSRFFLRKKPKSCPWVKARWDRPLCANRTGSWAALGGPPALPDVTQAMFELTIDHGDPPVAAAAYAYATLPGVALADFEAGGWAAALAAAPLTSTGTAHAALLDAASGTLLAAVFDNVTAVPVPPQVRGLTRLALPFPAASR